jgi:thiol-disulfide isomerase/thioredoxin
MDIKFLLCWILTGVIVHACGTEPIIWDYEFKSPDNQYHQLKEFKGDQLTVVDFWATWCKPCIRAMPELNEMYNEYKDKGVGLNGINIDSPRNIAKVSPFTGSMGIEYPVLLDPDQKLMSDFNIVAVPTLIILDSEANVIFQHTGYNPGDQSTLRNKIEEHLSK